MGCGKAARRELVEIGAPPDAPAQPAGHPDGVSPPKETAARRNGRTDIADSSSRPARSALEEHFAALAEHAFRAADTAAAECFSEIRRHEIDHLEAFREALIDIV
jgi:hypothetical protein